MGVPKITICVITHKKTWLPDDECYLPLHVGKSEHPEMDLGIQGDDTGDNISLENHRYSELTGIYWAWKNVDADYIGCVQYRRFFMYKEKSKADSTLNIMTAGEAIAACEQTRVVVPKKRNYYVQTLAHHFLSYSFAEPDDLDNMRQAIANVDPTYISAFDEVMARRSGHMCNMFIMRRDLFDSYCAWLFGVMDVLNGLIDGTRARILGYFAEHMLDIWMTRNGVDDYLEVDSVFLDRENEVRKRVGYLFRLVGAKKASERFVQREGSSVIAHSEARDQILKQLSNLKGSRAVRAVTAPAMNASFLIRDLTYHHSSDSRYLGNLERQYDGQACFIIGNGPSLRISDLDQLSHEITFAANRIYLLFDRTSWRPTFYVATDREFLARDAHAIDGLAENRSFVYKTSSTRELAGAMRDVTFINSHKSRFSVQRYATDAVMFSSDPTKVLGDGYTVTFTAIQLALWMGFTDLYLIGMDHTFDHEVDERGNVRVNKGVRNHVFDDPEGAVINPQPRQGVEYAYWLARYEAEARGVHIYNATRGGALEVFERIDLDELLREITEGKGDSNG